MTARMLAWKQPFIQRVRNSSLVERRRADDERALRPPPKPRAGGVSPSGGRGALRAAKKGVREGPWSARKGRCRHE